MDDRNTMGNPITIYVSKFKSILNFAKPGWCFRLMIFEGMNIREVPGNLSVQSLKFIAKTISEMLDLQVESFKRDGGNDSRLIKLQFDKKPTITGKVLTRQSNGTNHFVSISDQEINFPLSEDEIHFFYKVLGTLSL